MQVIEQKQRADDRVPDDELGTAIHECMLSDQPVLRQRLARLNRKSRRANGQRNARTRLRKAIAKSIARRRRRQENLPPVTIPESLPIHFWSEQIGEAVRINPVTIVCGETGSGKTTQLPKICLGLGRGVSGFIGHTQPRRLAARGVASRIAEELDTTPGKVIGHKVRFDRDVGPDCYVKMMTDGILLAEVQSDPMLTDYDTIIVDEAHERSLNVDFLLGYIKTLLPKRPELKLIVSSATIDTQRFSDYFDGAPVIEVEGRAYPVDVRYEPPEQASSEPENRVAQAVSVIMDLWAAGDGDVLAFFPGERDIHEALKKLRGQQLKGSEILPLYARLPLAAQRRILEPGTVRRIVLATNVAETSVTVPNVRYVVDTGVARIGRYNRHAGVARLPIEPVSQASADQRKGRCGRIGPGVCVRLYSKADYDARAPFGEPEILRSNLASVLLRMRALGLKDLAEFPFIDAPDRRHVNDGLRLLRELRALDDADGLTAIGRRLARLPLDPRLGRMLLAAEDQDCVSDILIIAAALSVADPKLRPPGRETAANAAHRRFADERSDFLTLLNLWDLYHGRTRGLPDDALHAFCRKRFLSLARMREWQDVHDQLRLIAAELGIRRGHRGAAYTRIHKALLAGLLRNVGFLNAEREYTGVRGASFLVAPGSAQHGGQAKWIVAAELVETTRLYAFMAARIRPEWVENAAGNLIRKTYFDAHWDRRRGQCMVYEQCALYGLTVIPGRRRRYAPISPSEARRIFIRAALVEGHLDVESGFLLHNRDVISRLRSIEDRLRQPDSLISDGTLFEFYDHRVPSGVFDQSTFERWVRDLDPVEFDALCLNEESLIEGKLDGEFDIHYPERIDVDGHELELSYKFAPGAPDDGVSLLVPVELLTELDHRRFGWLVPGYLAEKVHALLRGLSKSYRREIVPLTDVVETFVTSAGPGEKTIVNTLSEHVRRLRGVDVADGDWQEGRLANHLRMNFKIIGADGALLDSGRDFVELQRRLVRHTRPPSAEVSTRPAEQNRHTAWRFGEIPLQTEVRRGGRATDVFPALEDEGNSVSLVDMESRERAFRTHRRGVRRMFLLTHHQEIQRLGKRFPAAGRLRLSYALVDNLPPPWIGEEISKSASAGNDELVYDLIEAAAMIALTSVSGLDVRTATEFERISRAASTELPSSIAKISELCDQILDMYRAVRLKLDESPIAAKETSIEDIHNHLRTLVFRGFISATPPEILSCYPRYLQALVKRVEKLKRGGARDADKVALVEPHWRRFTARSRDHAARGRQDDQLSAYRWMIEEYRISLFAQEIGTAHPISRQRLDRQWAKVMP